MKAGRAVPQRVISLRENEVIKVQEPEASRRERLRTMAGREVGQRTGLFVVPEIVTFDDSRGEIVFERLKLTGLREVLADDGRSMELVGRAAAALAAIHGHMKLADEATGHRGGIGIGAGRVAVPLHGDFGMRNIFYLPDSDDIAIIDWANAEWTGVEGDRGLPEIDLAVFLISLFNHRLFGPGRISRRHEVARHFLATYASASPHGLNIDALKTIVAATTPAFVRLIRRLKGSLRALSYRHNFIDLSLFLRRLPRQGFTGPTNNTQVQAMEQPRSALPYIDRHKTRGHDYHESFSPEVNPYRAMVWRLEQRVLDGILRDHLTSGRIAHLDFACGTGRILGHLLGRVNSATGVDVSSSMMEVARKVAPGAELIEADLTQQDILDERSFDLITAFRFFPNAEPELRRAVFSALARHLAPRGVLVFNNHKNRNSLRRRISRLLGREIARGTMTHAEVEALVAQAGLRIVEIIPLAVLPLSATHPLLPVSVIEPVERWLGGSRSVAGLAQDVIYVCARA